MLRTASVLVLGVMMMGAGTAPVPLISHRALYDVTLENGVSSDLRISYPDFTLKGRLVKLQPIVVQPKC